MSGYDLVIAISEEFMNHSLRTLYNERVIPRKYTGEHFLNIPLLPIHYNKTTYEIEFNKAPYIDALLNEHIKLSFSADARLSFGLLNIESSIEGHIQCKPTHNRAFNQLELNIIDVDLEHIAVLGFLKLPDLLVKSTNDIISEVVIKELANIDNIPITPIIGNLDLPETPKGHRYLLPIGFGAIEIIDENTVALGFDIAHEGAEPKTGIENINLNRDILIRISRSAINKINGFWWEHTTHPKKVPFKGRIPIKNVDKLMNYLSNYSVELFPKLFSLGLIELDWDLIELWLDYEGTAEVSKPFVTFDEDSLSIEAVSIIDITAFLRVELDISLEFDTSGAVPDVLTPWEDDRIVGTDRRVYTAMRYTANRKEIKFVDDDAKLILDDKQRVVLDFNGFDLDLGLNWRLPHRLVKAMEKKIEKNINSGFPRIPLSPSILKTEIKDTDLSLELDIKEIDHRKNALQINFNIDFHKD